MDAGQEVEKPCIFEALLTPAEGYTVPTPDQIKDEAYAILNAASDTTGNAMTVAAYNIVTNPEMYETLTAELKAAFPDADDKIEYLKLEKLPYLVSLVTLSSNNTHGFLDRSYQRRTEVSLLSELQILAKVEDYLLEFLGVCHALYQNLA